ncbi:MAG: hypothetical protein GY832_21575 [Chloroflexi bacterium]|nr:hypothetical protein [Chloroflexota bacterium]
MPTSYNVPLLTTVEKIERIITTLTDLDRKLAYLRADVADLETAGICTGSAAWRHDNGTAPKMYANHGMRQSCPVHGEPPANGRLRSYVGLDPARQAQARATMDRCRKKAELEQQIGHVEIQVSRIERAITNAYYAASNQQRWEW